MKTAGYFMCIALLLGPASTLAQMHGGGMHGGSGQQMMGPDYQVNEDTMNGMRHDMNQLRSRGSLSPDHQREMQQMMNDLDNMQHQMRSSQGGSMQGQYQRRLQDMQQRLDAIKRQQR
jgi:hypothetical protein